MDENQKRLEDKLDKILEILHGDETGDMGMIQRVSIIWRVFIVWPLCTGSAVAGAVVTILVQKLFK